MQGSLLLTALHLWAVSVVHIRSCNGPCGLRRLTSVLFTNSTFCWASLRKPGMSTSIVHL